MASLNDFTTPVDRHRFHFQYVTTPTADTLGTALLLHFDTKRYLFGRLAEGTQRACTERGLSLKKARNIFLTGETSWQSNGGLLGMILTLADVIGETSQEEKKALGNIRIHGGPKIWHTIACARRFIFRTGMPLRVYEASAENWNATQEPDFYDDNILMWTLPIRKTVPEPNDRTDWANGVEDLARIEKEQSLREQTVHNMFDSDWRKDRLHESTFQEVKLPAMVWVRDPTTKDLQATFCAQMSDAPHISPDQKVFVRMPWPAALVPELPPADNLPASVAMSYLVKGRPQRGLFIAAKAKAAGVTPGPLFGKLANGESVTLEDGRVVKPEDVMDPVEPGHGVVVLDVPDVQYLPDLLQKLSDLRKANIMSNIDAFLWTLGPGISSSEAFVKFIAQFSNVKHIVSSPENNPNHLSMDASAASAARLNHIRPNTFKIPKHNNEAAHSISSSTNIVQAQRGLVLHVSPTLEVDTKEVPGYLDIPKLIADMSWETKNLVPAPSTSLTSANSAYDDISITTLGTGSAVPSKYRNVSANLVHIPALGYFILDAGENTLGQLSRLYTPEELDDVLCNLHMIWISHLHADHHLGTVPLLAAHQDAVRRRLSRTGEAVSHKLYLLSERNMCDYLEDYKSVQSTDAVLLHCLNSKITDTSNNSVRLEDTTMPAKKLDSTRVSHCHGAQAVSITFSNDFKLSYSGDCRPSASFAQIGQNSDILIHEATFDDGMDGDAMAKKHCTIGEALGVANAMKAKNVILTHFSQRYQKLPTLTDVKSSQALKYEEGDDATDPAGPLVEEGESNANATAPTIAPIAPTSSHDQDRPDFDFQIRRTSQKPTRLQEAARDMNVCIAFDLMRVTIPQIKDMYKYYPAIESMFNHESAKSDEARRTNREANEARLDERQKSIQKKREANEAKVKKSKQEKKAAKQAQAQAQGKSRSLSSSGRDKKSTSKSTASTIIAAVVADGETTPQLNKRTSRSKSPLQHEAKKAKLNADDT